jgi:excisionase family DNA binding protein
MQELASLLNRPQSAAFLSVSLRTFDERVAKGDIQCVRIGRLCRFRREALEAFIEASESRLTSKRRAAIRGKRK